MGLTEQRQKAKNIADYSYQQNQEKFTDYRQEKINRPLTFVFRNMSFLFYFLFYFPFFVKSI